MHMTDEDDEIENDVEETVQQNEIIEANESKEPYYRGKVLIIDDSPATCVASAKVLKLNNYEVICAKSAKAGYDLAIRYRHEIVMILIDFIMPKVDGLECLSWFKDHHILSQIPAFMLSCNHSSETEMIELCRSSGAADLLGKPFTSDALDLIHHAYALVTVPDSPEPTEEINQEPGKVQSSISKSKIGKSTPTSGQGNPSSYRFNAPAAIPVRPRNILPSKKIIRPAQIKYIQSSSFNDSTIVYGDAPPPEDHTTSSRTPSTAADSPSKAASRQASTRGSAAVSDMGGTSSSGGGGGGGRMSNAGKVSTDEEKHTSEGVPGSSTLLEGMEEYNLSSSTVNGNGDPRTTARSSSSREGPETVPDTDDPEPLPPTAPPLHVLLIHDNSLCSIVAAQQLTAEGYTLTITNTCQHAYELLCAAPYTYSVVLYDVIMPVNDGVALLQLMREDQSVLREVTFVMLTGLQGEEYAQRCATMGVSAVLRKPFSLEKFKHAIQPLLQLHV